MKGLNLAETKDKKKATVVQKNISIKTFWNNEKIFYQNYENKYFLETRIIQTSFLTFMV